MPAATAQDAPIDRERDGFPDLPADARDVADRALACMQLMRVYPTPGDQRDPEIVAFRTEMRCATVRDELAAIRRRHAGDARVLGILDEMPAR